MSTLLCRSAATTVLLWLGLKVASDEITVEPGGEAIQSVLDRVEPGDVIILKSGDYFEDLKTRTHGTEDKRITIKGAGGRSGRESVVLRGAGDSTRVFQLMHDYYTLEDFTIDGRAIDNAEDVDEDNAVDAFRDILLFVAAEGTATKRSGGYMSALDGLIVTGMVFKNALSECVRIRNFVTYADIDDNIISDCGLLDFEYAEGQNGEGIYICFRNRIRNNQITTNGNEGVDVKEGCLGTIVENNVISMQLDENSGGINSNADNTIITGHKISNAAGAGVRVGTDEPDDDGRYFGFNTVIGNMLVNCLSYGVKINTVPQVAICGNDVELLPGQDKNTYKYSGGGHGDDYEPFESCGATSAMPNTPAPTPRLGTPTAPPSTSTPAPSLIPGAVYLGCFLDKPGERTMLPGYKARNSLTNEACIEHCKNDGKRFAGTTIGRMCRCTNYESNVWWHGESTNCNMECPQESAMPCGGDWALTSWEILPGSSWETSTDWR